MDYYAKLYCLGGRFVCLTCQTQKCGQATHQRIYLGPKFRIPRKNNQPAWNRLTQQVNSGQIKSGDFYAPACEYYEYKELYRDIPRRSKQRRANYNIGDPRSNYHRPIVNAWGHQERGEYYSGPTRWERMKNEEILGTKRYLIT